MYADGLLTVGVVVPKRHFFKTGLRLVAVSAATACLTACAGMNVPFYGKLGEADAPKAEMANSAETMQTTPVAVAPLDPINAPPPGGAPVAPNVAAADPLLVPAPGSVPKTDTSQRVPLGTFGAVTPASGAPVSITQPPAKQPTAMSPAPQAQAMLEQPPAAQMSAPEPKSNPMIQPRAMTTPTTPMPATPKPQMPAPTMAEAGPAEPPKAPVLHLPPSKSDGMPATMRATPTDESQETVVISSDSTKPVFEAREFVPASLTQGPRIMPPRGLSDVPMTAGEKNVVQRFETLRRLQDESLITQDEYARRRNANIGALLPYTHEPASVGLERSVPSSDAIVARLQALRRSFEMRAITATQHALERSMILNALLPETPDDRTDRRPPPEDVIEGAAMVGHLDALRAKSLISTAELDAEKDAIEHVLRTGLLPSQEMAGANAKKAGAKGAAAMKSKTADAATMSADAGEQEITGPVLHLASFRSEDSAKRAWQEAMDHNKAALGSLKPIIRRVDLGPDKGIFYRLMAGPFRSLSDAEAVCIQLKQNNQFCRASADGN